MKLGIRVETRAKTGVAATPETVRKLTIGGHQRAVAVQTGAGSAPAITRRD
jgi:NAD/NADP transhydrogenase alpha subunit